jgi:hypothetical protein
VRPEDDGGPQRRGSQALEDATFTVDRDDRDERERAALIEMKMEMKSGRS